MASPVDTRADGLVTSRYRPSARTVLLVRFDPGNRELFETIVDEQDPTANQNTRLEVAGQEGDAAANSTLRRRARLDTGVNAGQAALYRSALTDARRNLSAAVANLPVDDLSRFIDVQPIGSTRKVNSYRMADELTVTLDWKSIPFDSRLVRSILCFHYEGTVPATPWATGVPEEDPTSPDPTGYLVPATGENLRFVGLADDISDSHGGGDTVTLNFRDLTALLIDGRVPPTKQKRIQRGQTVVDAIRSILDINPSIKALIRGPFLEGITVGELPVLGPDSYPKLAVSAKEKHRQAQSGGSPSATRKQSKGGASAESYWDAITDLAVAHGVHPVIRADRLVLFRPRTLFSENPDSFTVPGAPAFPPPGSQRARLEPEINVRRMVYGRNIEKVSFKRKMSRMKVPAIEVRAVNPDAENRRDRLIKVTHPPFPRYVSKTDPSGANPTKEVQVITVQGITDERILRDIAEQAYEGIGRQELGLSFSTNDVSSFSDAPGFDPNLNPDLLALQAGDPIRLIIEPRDGTDVTIRTMAELSQRVGRTRRSAGPGRPDLTDPVRFLVAQGFRPDVARQFAAVLASANLTDVFRVNAATISFDKDSGFSISIDMRNYIRVRADRTDPTITGGVGRTAQGGVSLTLDDLSREGIDFGQEQNDGLSLTSEDLAQGGVDFGP